MGYLCCFLLLFEMIPPFWVLIFSSEFLTFLGWATNTSPRNYEEGYQLIVLINALY